MDIYLVRTSLGLQASDDDGFELLHKIPIGKEVKCHISMPRNPRFHRKFFSLLRAAWDCLTEQQRNNLRSVESFREQLLITSGFSEPMFDITGNKFMEKARSISFSNMDEAKFSEVYSRVLDTVLTILTMNGVSEEEFNNILSNYS